MSKSGAQAVAASIALSVRERMLRKVSDNAAAYEARWTMRSLCRVDPELYAAIMDQQCMFHETLVTGEDEQIIEHGNAMCRGWIAAITRMEQEGFAEDVAMVGYDPDTGTTVVIAEQRAAEKGAARCYGENVIFVTPDEVAAMVAGMRGVADVKSLWPGAEIVAANRKVGALGLEPAEVEE